MAKKVGLHWFRKDLRVQDNPSLAKIATKVDLLICVYFETATYSANDILTHVEGELTGPQRQRFNKQALTTLNLSLCDLGSQLHVIERTTQSVNSLLVELVQTHDVTHVSAEFHCGYNEQHEWQQFNKTLTRLSLDIELIQENASTLYLEQALSFSVQNMPKTFTPFRKIVEANSEVSPVIPVLRELPPSPNVNSIDQTAIQRISLPLALPFKASDLLDNYYVGFKGGESSALEQLHLYLWESNDITQYKQTRNGLDGWRFSSKLSAWLANGCISARQIYAELKLYEQQRTSNESTYWLFFELLWREFFHWHHYLKGRQLFLPEGVQGKVLNTQFDANIFRQWQAGETGYPLVDACMRQLSITGFMSNRGRQLVASCLVHELNQHWYLGAKHFEYHLIDFDVASNWGNWQYLGGVGADPRGHRQFNLSKQADIYDPQGEFTKHWLDYTSS